MRLRVLLVSLVLTVATLGISGAAGPAGVVAAAPPATGTPVDTVPDSTFNDFIPEQRDLSDCISAVQKPGCGSESRSDYHQWLVFIALVGGMGLIAWRVVVGARRNRARVDGPETRTPQPQP